MKAKRTAVAAKGQTIEQVRMLDELQERIRDLEVLEAAVEGAATMAEESEVRPSVLRGIARGLWEVRSGIADATGLKS
jgi:hypothetical protein